MMGLPTVAIIGRPNVGKSTLFNRIIGGREAIVDARPGVTRDRHLAPAEGNGKRFWLRGTGGPLPGGPPAPDRARPTPIERALGRERLVVAEEPGTTRDAIDTPFAYDGRRLVFIDTAGLRKRSKVADDIEFYSTLRSSRAIERADVCILVVDALDGVHVQDLKIANEAWDKGTGLIVAVNKWDLIAEKETNTAVRGERELVARAPVLEFLPVLSVSAKTGQRVPRLLALIVTVAAGRQQRVPTSQGNRVLATLAERAP